MKSIKIAFSILSLGLLLTVTSCGSKTDNESGSTDSTTMDNTGSGMSMDSVSTDTMSTDSASNPM